jgi:hypothetical protein
MSETSVIPDHIWRGSPRWIVRIPKDLVPEEGVEPSRGVNPTGF